MKVKDGEYVFDFQLSLNSLDLVRGVGEGGVAGGRIFQGSEIEQQRVLTRCLLPHKVKARVALKPLMCRPSVVINLPSSKVLGRKDE